MRGIYTLAIRLERNARCRIAALGTNCFKKGMYLYTGSARGQGSTSLERRIERHGGRQKSRFWHIDYLLGINGCRIVACVYSETSRDLECAANRTIQKSTGRDHPMRGFGSSDCNCRSHLMYIQSGNARRTLHLLMAAYRKLGLKPKLWDTARLASLGPIA